MHENAKFARHPLYVRLLSILSLKNIFKLEDYIVKSLSNDKGNYYISLFGSYPYKINCFPYKMLHLKEKLIKPLKIMIMF